MALDTFTPPRAPAPGQTGKNVAPRVLRAQFGDSYSQRSPDGINPVVANVTLDWPLLLPADADTIEAFFAAKQGATAFRYTLPLESVEKIWTCASWKRSYPSVVTSSIQATLVQEFDLGT